MFFVNLVSPPSIVAIKYVIFCGKKLIIWAALPSDGSHHRRFIPCTRIADRYRIVSLIGKGVMNRTFSKQP